MCVCLYVCVQYILIYYIFYYCDTVSFFLSSSFLSIYYASRFFCLLLLFLSVPLSYSLLAHTRYHITMASDTFPVFCVCLCVCVCVSVSVCVRGGIMRLR